MEIKRYFVLALLAAVFMGGLVAGCGSPAPEAEQAADEAGEPVAEASTPVDEAAEGANPLADTSWRLVEFQSMDDATGTIKPDDPSLHTMTLNADGSVNMALDCNRAMGTWSAELGPGGESGTFSFGPLAGTRALCPPPSMDERIVRDSEWIRGFLLRDGNLYLTLMADGGIYAWEPDPGAAAGPDVAFEAQPDSSIEAAILAATPDYDAETVEIMGRKARYVYSRFDLDDDGTDEVLVLMLGSIFCGTGGCDLFLLRAAGDGYEVLQKFVRTSSPVIASEARSEGWHDLIRLESGGGALAEYVRHVFDGERYIEKDRTDADEEPAGVELLAGEYTYAEGAPLEPGG